MSLKANARKALSPASRILVMVLRAVIALGVAAILCTVAVYLDPPLIAWGSSAMHQNPTCSPADAVDGLRKYMAQHGSGERDMARQTHTLKEDGSYRLLETPRGQWWVPLSSVQVLPTLLAQQASKIYGDGNKGVQPGDVVIDCGAHVGVYTREALSLGAKLVVAVEPAPDKVESLRRNFAKEIAAGQVVVLAKGVWDKEDLLPLFENPANSAGDSFVMKGENDKVRGAIPLTTIDHIVQELRLGHVNFIKMDINGATTRALQGASATLLKDRPKLAISTEAADDKPRDVLAALHLLQPAYQFACGTCSMTLSHEITPDVLLLH
jgi:FkbM family methyltransferase